MNTLQMIEVMQAHLSGKKIEWTWKNSSNWGECAIPTWDWAYHYYRVKPEIKKYRVCLVSPHILPGQPRPYAVPESEWGFMGGKYPWISEVLEYEPQGEAKG